MASVFAQDKMKNQMNRDNVVCAFHPTVSNATLSTTNAAGSARRDVRDKRDNVL